MAAAASATGWPCSAWSWCASSSSASLVGPPIIRSLTGYTYDYIPIDPALIESLPPFTAPDGSFSWTHPMGTDNAGRDILARVLLGGRISLMVGIISTLVSLIIGITFGATAGYLGGKIDEVMMRIVDVLYAIPYMMIVIVLLAFFGGQSPLGQLVLLFVALGAVSWLTMARIVRGQVMSLKNQEFILAARATGVPTWKIIVRHLVPNTLGPVIVYATLTIPSVMLLEAFLSFLGLGVQAPLASWGSLAADGIQNIAIFPWQLICPGITMAHHAVLAEFPRRRTARRARSPDEKRLSGHAAALGPRTCARTSTRTAASSRRSTACQLRPAARRDARHRRRVRVGQVGHEPVDHAAHPVAARAHRRRRGDLRRPATC